MNRWNKIAVVCAGYVLAVVAAVVAGHMYNLRMAAEPYDTSGGMYAAGEMMASLGAFLVVALVPTLLALWFLRSNRMFWTAIGVGAFSFAAVGLVAVLVPPAAPAPSMQIWLVLFSLLGLAQLLGVPLWTAAFGLFAILAPTPRSRRLMIAAVGLELVIAVCAFVHWFVPRPPI